MPTLAELYRALKGYAKDALPGGNLNPETKPVADHARYIGGMIDPNSTISNDLQNWHKRTQLGLADQLAGRQTPAAEQAYQTMMQMAGVAPVGMTAWHGSPHKFDKFSLDKIGTGEGAQAYGHGLYLAETPAVAQEYADALGKEVLIKGKPAFRAKDGTMAGDLPVSSGAAGHLRMNDWDLQKAIKDAENTFIDTGDQWFAKVHKELSTLKPEDVQINRGQMYKTDIPDEAVARFLDWDKPLSQQAPEVQKALSGINDEILSSWKAQPAGSGFDLMQGVNAYDALARGRHSNPAGNVAAAEKLKAAGIPGIRYLDGGSRSAGQGSSNFVAFDPEMIRILERNGQPTGQKPWGLGEWLQRMQPQN